MAGRPRARLGTRYALAGAFGALAGLLCVFLSFAVGERAREMARVETGRTLARLAAEYRGRIDHVLAAPLAQGAGRVAVRADLRWAGAMRSALESSADPAGTVELMLLERDGAVLIGPGALLGAKVPLPPRGEPAVQRWADGKRYLVAALPVRGPGEEPGWFALARTPVEATYGAAAGLQRHILWAGLLLTLAGIAGGWVLATRHARPLEALTRAAGAIAAGHDRTEIPPLDDNPEVERLAQALRAMVARLREQAESLRQAQDRLQQRVHERTAELVRVQAELELQVAEAQLAREELARALDSRGEKA